MTEPGRPQADPTDERLALAKAVTGLLEWAQETTAERVPELVTGLRGHLGDGAADAAVVSREFAVFDRVNLQLALDAWTAEPGRSVEVVGYTIPPCTWSRRLSSTGQAAAGSATRPDPRVIMGGWPPEVADRP